MNIICNDFIKIAPDIDYRYDLVIADPPFNTGYKYDQHKDDLQPQAYLDWTADWLEYAYQLTRPYASLYVCIGDEYAAEVKQLLDMSGFFFRSWIIWHYTFGVYCPAKWGRGHTHIFYYTKDRKRWTWNPEDVRIPSDRQKKYNDKRANPAGKVPMDVWTFPRVCGTFKERTGHPCQMPEALIERMIRASSNPGDSILDPFCGSGTVPAVAKRLRRTGLGVEISEKYVSSAKKRVAEVSEEV